MPLLSSGKGLIKTRRLTASSVFNLLFNGTNGSTDFVDTAKNKTVIAYGNAQISTAQSVSGGSSGYFDGDGDYLSIPADVDPDFNFGTSNFTIELYFHPLSSGTDRSLFFKFLPSSERYGLYIRSDNKLAFRRQDSGGIDLFSPLVSTTTIATNTWYKAVITRVGNTLSLLLNDVTEDSRTISVSIFGVGDFKIGALDPGTAFSWYFNGYIDDFKITK